MSLLPYIAKKKDFLGVIKDFVMGRYPGLSMWAQCNHKHPYKIEERWPQSEGGLMMEVEVGMMWLLEVGNELRNVGKV